MGITPPSYTQMVVGSDVTEFVLLSQLNVDQLRLTFRCFVSPSPGPLLRNVVRITVWLSRRQTAAKNT